MQLQIKHEFDLVFETIGLLYASFHSDDKDEVIRELCELGVDGEKFYKKYYKLIERYVRIFKKHVKSLDQAALFLKDKNEEFCLLIKVLICENIEWVNSLDGITDRQIREITGFLLQDQDELVTTLADAPKPKLEDEKDLIAFLSQLDCEADMKWQLLEFMRRPKYWLEHITTVIRTNIPACEKALLEMEKPLAPFLKDYDKQIEQQFRELAGICVPGSKVYPTFIDGVSQQVYCTKCYQGIFLEFLIKKGSALDEKKELVITRMKALSDKSKLDILCELKRSSKYNLELAEAMKLSPSTMSHHMNVLFACGLVGVEKKDGRIYYLLKQDVIMEFMEDLRQLLL